MLRKLLFSGLAVIGLLLAGPQKASAQTIFACVSSIGAVVIEPTADAPCPPSAGGPTWTKTTLSTTPGALGASQFSCGGGTSLTQAGPLFGSNGGYTPGVTFGSGITYAPMATNFVLQPGIYLLQLIVYEVGVIATGGDFTSFRVIESVNGSSVAFFSTESALVNTKAKFQLTGIKLLQVSAANTTVGFSVVFGFNNTATSILDCGIIFTRLQ
jgi:hypothetical protein